MPRNQLLGFHRVGERQYDLSGLRTGSVRDQFIRAFSITAALLNDVKEISRVVGSKQGLLIFGGGVSGITCALIAAQKGVPVTVIEKQRREFSTLARARSRRIAPFEYDWPRPMPDPSEFIAPPFPLQFDSDSAANHAATWQSAFNKARKSLPNLELLRNTNVRHFKCTTSNGSVQVKGPWPEGAGKNVDRVYGAVVSCTGFMRERTLVLQRRVKVPHPTQSWTSPVELRSYRGPRFWVDDDFLDNDKFDCQSRGSVERVLISGGGDGAMQDFQRAATKEFGLALLAKLEVCLKSRIQEKYLLRLMTAEDRARRACAWGMSNPNDPAPDGEMQIWDAEYREVVQEICRDFIVEFATENNIVDLHGNVDEIAATKPAFQKLADELLRDDYDAPDFPYFVWITKEPHLGFAYALNRFLSMFILTVLEKGFSAPRATLILGESIRQIVRDDPNRDCCAMRDCRGYGHHVSFASNPAVFQRFEIIVVRHGLIFPSAPYLGKRAPVKEQLVPYFIIP
ncbi:hypothetical protein [Caballeronia sp. LZ001]|uniref:hypothetical protein n=1 Tax=Caballeronia sp. LZ001 TaxID=3038553 RepID=UPI00285B1871|nr:hypothetical protein [Caballeronia sp. LZ001]MDR5803753.1 hypothetical protein [Caballeronia sp. LZ001]